MTQKAEINLEYDAEQKIWKSDVNYPWAQKADPKRKDVAEKASNILKRVALEIREYANGLDLHNGWETTKDNVERRFAQWQEVYKSSVLQRSEFNFKQPFWSVLFDGKHFENNPHVHDVKGTLNGLKVAFLNPEEKIIEYEVSVIVKPFQRFEHSKLEEFVKSYHKNIKHKDGYKDRVIQIE